MTLPRDPTAKLKHIDACMRPESQYQKTTGLENFTLQNEAGVELSLNSIDLTTDFFGQKISSPLMISPMTGGVERGFVLNQIWATAAEQFQIPMGVGSQRIALEKGDLAGLFQIRKHAPNAFIFANLGAANLTRKNAVDDARRAVDMIEANAIFIHFNAIQEACQIGDTNFKDALYCLESICAALLKDNVRVFAREVGFGLSTAAAMRFLSTGVDGIDCSGAGGTSWSRVEAMCSDEKKGTRLGMVFGEWGIPTAQSILNVRDASQDVSLVASGGIRSGLDIAKALALGADLAGMARPMLLAADGGEASLHEFIELTIHELRIAMFGCGAHNIDALKKLGIQGSHQNPIPA